MVARFVQLVALLLALSIGFPAAAGAEVPKRVQRVIADFRNDGRIEPCRHTARAYRLTLEEIEADSEAYAPDFPIAVQAAREERVDADCQAEELEEDQAPADEDDEEEGSGGSPAADPTATPAPTAAPTVAPAAPVTPVTPVTPESTPPASESTPAPSSSATPEAAVPAAPAAPAAPGTGAGITPGVPPPTTNQPNVILTRTSDNREARVPLAILAGLMAAALLGGALALLMRRFGWGEVHLAGMRHAWGEASYRTGGTWQDFTDWVRLGR